MERLPVMQKITNMPGRNLISLFPKKKSLQDENLCLT